MNPKRRMIVTTIALSTGMLTVRTAFRALGALAAPPVPRSSKPGQDQKADEKKPALPRQAKASKNAEKVRKARAKSENNLKQIALAMHNIASMTNPPRFPAAAIRDKQGKALLSWRVAILPYVEQQALYEKFHLDEPWDSPHNKALLKEIPEIYVPVIRSDEPKMSTYYQVFTGSNALFESREGPTFIDILDGTSNTLMVVEAGSPVPWTKPEDITYDKDKPVPKLGRIFPGEFCAAFADGSVRFLRTSIPEQMLRALITRSSGEIIDASVFEIDEKPAEE